ncbi:Flp pilus assembly pilin Flp [Methanobacterium petrolearium]|nr:Flp pilus assembly pilin Flp [Methanobacterium petrolearium]
MNFLKDENGQGAAEYILLFGGVIVIAVTALIIYKTYFDGNTSLNANNDTNSVRSNLTDNNSTASNGSTPDTPTPVKPTPVKPTPVKPTPVKPTPVKPTPASPI